MAGWIDAIEDDGQVRQGLADDIERAPNGAEDEFDVGIPLVRKVQADSDCSLTDHDSSNVVEGAYRRNPDTIEKFKDIGRDEDLRANHQNVAHRNE